MYAAITRVKVVPGKVDEVARRFRVRVPDATRGVPGFISSSLTANEAQDEVLIFGLWASQETLDAFRATPRFTELLSAFKELFVGEPEMQVNRVHETIEARVATLTY